MVKTGAAEARLPQHGSKATWARIPRHGRDKPKLTPGGVNIAAVMIKGGFVGEYCRYSGEHAH